MLSRQQIYNKVRKYLLTQKVQCFSAPSLKICAYRNAEGQSCAVGCLVSTTAYDESIEGGTVGDIISDVTALCGNPDKLQEILTATIGRKLQDADLALLDDLQNCHDSVKPRFWKTRLNKIARDQGLHV